MDETQLQAALEEIDAAYYANDEDRDLATAALSGYFEQLWDDADAAALFSRLAAEVAGGVYIPYLFWVALHRFLKTEGQREVIAELFAAFGRSNFDEATQLQLKPLAVVYFMHEKEFEVDRLKSRVIQKLHPTVQEFFQKTLEFVEKNRKSAIAYQQKFALVGAEFPDFERFNQPLAHLEG